MADEESGKSSSNNQLRVGIIYDERMCNHRAPDGDDHPENPNRIRAIWNKLLSLKIPQRCVVLNAKEAEDKYLQLVHSKKHVNLIKKMSSKSKSQLKRKASKFDSIYLSEGSPEAAYIAAGSVIEAAEKVASGELNSAAAIVRPPGHHAEHDEAMGFCLYNNVAVAASFILDEKPALGIKKILIVDWDVHHGNGTQKMFWKDPRVLVFSVHRHDFGKFYPCNDEGFYTEIGEGPGSGYNINVPWENGGCGDADYLAVWDHILIPVAKEFNPDMVIVSAGYDAAVNDPLGGCCVTPYGYSVLLKKLMEFGNGKIVLALEGGYNLDSLSDSFVACMEVLLESKHINGSSEACPLESTWRVILQVCEKLSEYWPVLTNELPLKLANKKSQSGHPITYCQSPSEFLAGLVAKQQRSFKKKKKNERNAPVAVELTSAPGGETVTANPQGGSKRLAGEAAEEGQKKKKTRRKRTSHQDETESVKLSAEPEGEASQSLEATIPPRELKRTLLGISGKSQSIFDDAVQKAIITSLPLPAESEKYGDEDLLTSATRMMDCLSEAISLGASMTKKLYSIRDAEKLQRVNSKLKEDLKKLNAEKKGVEDELAISKAENSSLSASVETLKNSEVQLKKRVEELEGKLASYAESLSQYRAYIRTVVCQAYLYGERVLAACASYSNAIPSGLLAEVEFPDASELPPEEDEEAEDEEDGPQSAGNA